MQIQPTIRAQGRTVAATQEYSAAAGTKANTGVFDVSWSAFAHRRRLARMNRDLLKYLIANQSV